MKLNELFSLKDKTALVTGGGRGIGKFIATGLAEAGADLILVSRKMKNLESAAKEISEAFGVQVYPIACDIAKAEDIENMVKAATEKCPRIDILVNNAGATVGRADPGISSGEMGPAFQRERARRRGSSPRRSPIS